MVSRHSKNIKKALTPIDLLIHIIERLKINRIRSVNRRIALLTKKYCNIYLYLHLTTYEMESQ